MKGRLLILPLWFVSSLLYAQGSIEEDTIALIKAYINRHSFDSAWVAIDKLASRDDLKGQLNICRGMIFLKKSKPDSALNYSNKALALFTAKGDSLGMADAQNLLGGAYYQKGDLNKSLENYLGAFKYYEKNVPGKLGVVYTNTALIQNALGRIEESIATQKKAIAILDDELEFDVLFYNLLNLSSGLSKLGQLDSSIFYAERALTMSREKGFQHGILQASAFLSNIYLGVEDYESAIRYSESIIDNPEIADRPLAQAYYVLGKAYNKKGDTDRALQYANNALEIVNRMGNVVLISAVHTLLYEVSKNQENFEEALHHHEIYHSIDDSTLNAQKSKALNELEIKYETEKKDSEIKVLSQTNQIQELQLRQQNLFILIVLLIALIVTITFILLWRQRRLKEQQKTDELNQRLLRTQLNPHFLFNALNAIQQKILTDQNRSTAADYLAKFSQMTRQILETNKEDLISLEEELELLEKYIDLQKLRSEHFINVEFKIAEDLETDRIRIPPMLTQPILENAFEHGLLPKIKPGRLIVDVSVEDTSLRIIVKDNGEGFDAIKQQNHRSMGSSITTDRLKLLQKKTGKKTSYTVESLQEEGFKFTAVTLIIPLL